MQKQKPVFNHLPGLGKLIPDAQKATSYRPTKIKTMPIRKTETETKIKLSPITPHLLIINLKLKCLRKTNVIKVVEKTMQLLGSMLPRWPKK